MTRTGEVRSRKWLDRTKEVPRFFVLRQKKKNKEPPIKDDIGLNAAAFSARAEEVRGRGYAFFFCTFSVLVRIEQKVIGSKYFELPIFKNVSSF